MVTEGIRGATPARGAEPVRMDERAIAAGRAAWVRYIAAQELGFDQLMDVGRALVIGRHHAMHLAGQDRPVGAVYVAAFRVWCQEQGFDAMPRIWRMDLMWCAENEAKVRAARAVYRQNHTKAEPSINPRSMRNAAEKQERHGASAKRLAPTVFNMSVEVLCDHLERRFDAMPPGQVLSEVERFAETLEAVVRRAEPRHEGLTPP